MWEKVRQASLSYRLKSLTEHHRLLCAIVQAQPGIVSSVLLERYRQQCASSGTEPVAARTFLRYISKLLRLGFLKEQPVARKSRTRSFFVAEALHYLALNGG